MTEVYKLNESCAVTVRKVVGYLMPQKRNSARPMIFVRLVISYLTELCLTSVCNFDMFSD